MKVCIIGAGVLGDATGYALNHRAHSINYHDPLKGLYGSAAGCDVALICVPTPMGPLGYCVRDCVHDAARWLDRQDFAGFVGIRSTVVPGTCDEMQEAFPAMGWFSWPEFLRDSLAREDAKLPTRVVVGCDDTDRQPLESLVPPRQIGMQVFRRVWTTPTGAECIKYATNAIHAVNVGLANELAALASAWGLDWNELLPPLTSGDPYLPDNIVVTDQGGFGGKCLPKDTAALLYHAQHDRGIELPILAAVDAENRKRRPEEYQPGEATS